MARIIRYVSKDRIGINNEVETHRKRGSNGRFYKVYKGNFQNSSFIKGTKFAAQRFGSRKAKYRDVRAAFGLSAG